MKKDRQKVTLPQAVGQSAQPHFPAWLREKLGCLTCSGKTPGSPAAMDLYPTSLGVIKKKTNNF